DTGRQAELYVGTELPKRPFYEIALVQAVGYGSNANLTDVTRALGDRAGHLGCDAVVRVTVDQGYNLAHGYGVCVRYLELAAAPAVPPQPAPADTSPLLPPAPPPASAPPAPTPAPEPAPASVAPSTGAPSGGTSSIFPLTLRRRSTLS